MTDVANGTTLLAGLAGPLAGACALQARGPAESTDFTSHHPEGENHVTQMSNASGFAEINSARLYYEVAGQGPPFVMIHAGVADSRQWNEELRHFSEQFRVLRYDMRGYGKSEPVAGDFNHDRSRAGCPNPAKFEEVEAAYSRGDNDRVAELKTQIWFDGEGRSPDQVDLDMRKLAYDMNRLVLMHEAKRLGNRLPNTLSPAA